MKNRESLWRNSDVRRTHTDSCFCQELLTELYSELKITPTELKTFWPSNTNEMRWVKVTRRLTSLRKQMGRSTSKHFIYAKRWNLKSYTLYHLNLENEREIKLGCYKICHKIKRWILKFKHPKGTKYFYHVMTNAKIHLRPF